MPKSRLIIRLPESNALRSKVAVTLSQAQIADQRIGERVMLGLSETPGVWTFLGEALLHAVVRGSAGAILLLKQVTRFDSPVAGVTDSSLEADQDGRPFTFDELMGTDYQDVLLRAGALGSSAGAGLEEAAMNYLDQAEILNQRSWLSQGLAMDHPLYDRAMRAYGRCCAITLLPLPRRGGEREGMVLPIDVHGATPPAEVSDVFVCTSTLAFYYIHGSIVFSSGSEILADHLMEPEIVTLMQERNPTGRLHVPADPKDWPSLDAMRRHRDRFGK